MKIINRAEFLELPNNTLYSKYQPCSFEELEIKGDNAASNQDFWSQSICDSIDHEDTGDFFDTLELAREEGKEIKLDFYAETRDGMFDENQLFAIWSKEDIKNLIKRLQECL